MTEKMGRLRGLPVEQVADMRPTCLSCLRPQHHCLCELLPRFRAQCNIAILQHPAERKKYHGTARMVTLAIENAQLKRGLYFAPGEIERMFEGQNPYILFPSSDAVDCEKIELTDRDTVIAIDGTWSEAGKVLTRNPALKSFRRLTFVRPFESNFRIRKQPKKHYLSTLESIAHLLRLNALANGLTDEVRNCESLLHGFDRMVTRQFEYFPRNHRGEKLVAGHPYG